MSIHDFIDILLIATGWMLVAIFWTRSCYWKQKAQHNDEWAKFYKKCSDDWRALAKEKHL